MATVANALQITGGTVDALEAMNKLLNKAIDKTKVFRNEFNKPLNTSSLKAVSREISRISPSFDSARVGIKTSAKSINSAINTTVKSFQRLGTQSAKGIDTKRIESLPEKLSGKENTEGTAKSAIKKSSLSGIAGKFKGFMSSKLPDAQTVMDTVDKYSIQNARMSSIKGNVQSLGDLQQRVYGAAQNSRSSYDGTVSSVTKLGLSAKDKFKNNDEIINFTELLNKSFAGTDSEAASKGTEMITDAMVSGKLSGDDMTAVFENAPALGQAVSKYTGQSQQQLTAGDGISSDTIKNAMFSSADEINARFQSIPVTFQQIGTSIQNTLIQAFGPVMTALANGAAWVYQNWSTLAPIFWGLAAAVGAYAAGLGILRIVTVLQKIAQDGLNLSMLTSPLFWIALIIGVVIGLIFKWIQSVGGIHVAWLIVVNALLTAWDWVKIGFFIGVYWVIDLWNKMMLGIKSASVAIQNFMGDMKVGVLVILQNMVNGAIGIINKFIGLLNNLPGVQIDTISKMTFGTEAKAQNEAEKRARNAELQQYKSQIEATAKQHEQSIENMKAKAREATQERDAKIADERAEALKKGQSQKSGFNVPAFNSGAENSPAAAAFSGNSASSGLNDASTKANIANTAANTGAMKDTMDASEEDLKYMRDIAEQEVINRFTTSEIKVDMTNHNNINSNLDLDGVVSYMEQKVYETLSVAAEGVHG